MIESLFVLLGLALLAIPVSVIVLVVSHLRLRRDVQELRSTLKGLQGTAGPLTTSEDPADRVATPASQKPQTASDQVRATQDSAPAHPAPTPKPARVAQATSAARDGTPSRLSRLIAWLQENWFYAAATVSLALAGVFLVQYGVETGLLTPTARVVAALLFGAALITAGEVIRRRFGDDRSSATAYLPSVLSGAGLVSLMGGVLAARLLYDLIAPGPALGGLFGIALFGLWLGWRHGPLLAAVGLIGGMGAPFLVGGQSDHPEWLLVYFALLAALGLGIDTLRRWAWVSVLAVVLGGGAGLILTLSDNANESLAAGFAVYAAVLVALVVLIPARGLTPDHDGPCVSETVLASGDIGQPIFPVVLAMATMLAACFGLGLSAQTTPLTWALSLSLAVGLATLLILWSRRAPALQDHAALPLITLLALVALPELNAQGTRALTEQLAAQEGLTEQRMPLDITLVLLAGVLAGLACAWRSLRPGRFPVVWAGAGVLFAPLVGLSLEFSWNAADRIGDWPWALHALALAALMVAKAARFARVDGEDRLRSALATVSALACLAFALTVLLTDAALTLALASVVLSAAALDRRFDLPAMTGFIAAGIIALGYRLVIDPGLEWAVDVPVAEMLAAYGGTLVVLLAALRLGRTRPRPRARVFLESAAWSVAGMVISLSLYHAIEAWVGHAEEDAHWVLGLHATIWTGAALAQLERLKLGGALRWLRVGLAGVFGSLALGLLAAALSLGNPLLDGQTVHGPILLNTLIPAYLLPAILLALGAARLRHLARGIRLAPGGLAAGLGIFWLGLTIRHAWQGGNAMQIDAGIGEPELYSYTVALLLAGAGLFYQALARRSDSLRQAGVLVIGLAVAKVFLIDISGLAGLVRVFSFLLLGISLAGLAWLNRWVQTRAAHGTGTKPAD